MRRASLILAAITVLTLSPFVPAVRPVEGARPTREAPVAGLPERFPSKAAARVVILQDEQEMRVYEGDRLFHTFPISTGWPGRRQSWTPAWTGTIGEYWGTFESFGTVQDHGFFLFTDYIDGTIWNGDILIHSAPYLYGPGGAKVYDRTGIGSSPASHGCIRMQPEDIEWFQEWDPIGVSIEVRFFSDGSRGFPKLAVGAQLIGMAQPVATAPEPAPAPGANAEGSAPRP